MIFFFLLTTEKEANSLSHRLTSVSGWEVGKEENEIEMIQLTEAVLLNRLCMFKWAILGHTGLPLPTL